MRIACPACNAAYAVPDAQLSVARVVRCARCGTDWAPLDVTPEIEEKPAVAPLIEAPAPASVPVAEASIETAGMAIEEEPVLVPPTIALPKPAIKARTPVALVVAWVVSVGAVVAGVAGLYAGRERVMAAWPPSVRGYAAVGLAGRTPPAMAQGGAHDSAPAGHGSEGRE